MRTEWPTMCQSGRCSKLKPNSKKKRKKERQTDRQTTMTTPLPREAHEIPGGHSAVKKRHEGADHSGVAVSYGVSNRGSLIG